MLIYTEKLSGAMLNYYVGISFQRDVYVDKLCHKLCLIKYKSDDIVRYDEFNPSKKWSQGGPIIESQKMSVECCREANELGPAKYAAYYGPFAHYENPTTCYGSTHLEAAMRCVVKKAIGEKIDTAKYPVALE